MIITDKMVERAAKALNWPGCEYPICEPETCGCWKMAKRAARAALEAALSGSEIHEWKKPLYEDGKTPDQKSIDEAADEFRRKNITLSGKDRLND